MSKLRNSKAFVGGFYLLNVDSRTVLQGRGCKHLRAAAPDCKLEYPEPIRFYTGRSDCDQEEGLKGWQTSMKEHHPNPHGDGQVNTSSYCRLQ